MVFLTVCIFLCKIVCRTKQNSPKQTDREQTWTAQFLLTFQVLTVVLRMQGSNIQTRPHSLRVYFENQPGLRYWLKLPLTTRSCQMPRDYMKKATCRKRYTKVCKTIQRTWIRGVRFWCALDPILPSQAHFRRQWRNLTAFSKIFFDPPPRVMKIKTKINKWDLMKLKSFYTAKESINKRQTTEWEKIFANNATDKGLISKNTNSSCSSISKNQTTQSKNGQKT